MNQTSKGRVFVVQDTDRFSLAQATEYGELIPMLPKRQSIVMSSQPVVRELKRLLGDFNDDDKLLLIGDPVAIGLAVAIAAEANRGRVKMLKYDQRMQKYLLLEADLHDRPTKTKEDYHA